MAYRDLLTAATLSYGTAPDHDHVAAFLVALADLDAVRQSRRARPTHVVAHEIAYDVALIKLSQHLGIDTGPERFAAPEQERERLHRELVEELPALREVIYPFESSTDSPW